MPNATRAITVMAADRWRVGGRRHVQPARASLAARTARPVPRAAGRHGTPRQPGLDGLSVLLAGEVAAYRADRLPRRRHHHPRGGYAGARHRNDMGCRPADLGRLADRGGARRGLAPVALDTRHSLRDPALHRARHVSQRLPAPESRARPAAIDHGGHVHPRNHGKAIASLLVDQRVEGTGRCQRRAAGHRTDPAGLVLCGRARCRLGADHRPSLFPLEGRDRALAVPPGAQARRQAAGRLAIRLPAPAPQVGQRCALLRLRLRPARPGGAAVAARLRPGHRANAGRRTRTADLPARAAHGTGITRGKGVDGLVLSGVPGIVLSGVRLSCYQEYENAGKPITARVCGPSNFPNKKYITFSRSAPFRWTTEKRHGEQRFARQVKPGFPAGRAAP